MVARKYNAARIPNAEAKAPPASAPKGKIPNVNKRMLAFTRHENVLRRNRLAN